METWLTQDPHATIDGCKQLWADRTMESGKRNRLALLVNDRCCKSGHITVKEQLHGSNNELLAVGTRDITCCGISRTFFTIATYFPLRLVSEVSTSNDAQDTIKLWTYLMPTQGRHKLLIHRDPAPGPCRRALNKTPLLLRLPYTLSQRSQHIATPVYDYYSTYSTFRPSDA